MYVVRNLSRCSGIIFQKALYESGKVMSQVRLLLQDETVLDDDRKLCEYSLPEGTTISALSESDVDINIEISIGLELHKLTVSNSTSVMALKVKICGLMKCDVAPERLEIRLGDIMLEDPMPLHFYGIGDGSTLALLKPYICATIVNNHGTEIFWRLERKDSIKEFKAKLANAQSVTATRSLSSIGSRLYRITEDLEFDELDDGKTVDNCKIKDNEVLYLLVHRWTFNRDVTIARTGRYLRGVEATDTCLGIKVRAQELRLFYVKNGNYEVKCYLDEKEISDEKIPFTEGGSTPLLVVITQKELQTEDANRVEEERKTREARKEQEAIRNKQKQDQLLKDILGINPKK